MIVVANRGPLTPASQQRSTISPIEPSGGVATTLYAIAQQTPLTWISVASDMARSTGSPPESAFHTLATRSAMIEARTALIPERMYKLYCERISNGVLWFLQHYLLHPDPAPTFTARDMVAWNQGYVAANRMIADAVIDTIQRLDDTL